MARSVATLIASMALDAASFVTDIDRAAKRSQAALRKFRKTAETASKAIGSAIGVGLGVAIHEAIKFEKAMAEVGTLLDDTSGLDATADAIKRLSVEFGQAPTDQAKALYQIISAGASDATEQVELLTASNRLALGGVTDVATAADGLTTVLNAYAGSGLTASEVSDSLFTTMKQGKTTIEELSSSVGNVATIAAQTGVSLREVGAAVGTLTKSGIATGEAMNALRGVLAAVLKQSKQSTDTAADLGVAFSVSALQAQGLAGFLQQIADSGATEEQLAKLLGRVEGLSAVMALGANDAAEFSAQLEAQAKAAGATEDAVAKMAETTAFKISQVRSAFQVLAIEAGDLFLSEIGRGAEGIIQRMDEIERSVLRLTRTIADATKFIVNNFSEIASSISGIFVIRTLLPILGAFGPVGAAAAIAIGGITAALVHLNLEGKETKRVIDDLSLTLDIAAGKWNEYATAADIVAQQAKIRKDLIAIDQQLIKVTEELAQKQRFLHETEGTRFEELERLRRSQEQLTDAYAKGLGTLVELGRRLKNLSDPTKNLDAALDGFNKRIEAARKLVSDAAKALERAGKETVDFKDYIKSVEPELERIAELWEEVEEALDDAIEAQTRYENSIQSLLDAAFPIEKLTREYEQSVRDLNRAFNEGRISPEQYAVVITFLGDTLGRAALESQAAADQIVTDSDRMREAALEAVRQMTSAFLNMWGEIISGGEDAFDGLIDGFENLVAQFVHSISTAKVGDEIQNALNGGDFNFKNFSEGLAAAIGIAVGAEIGGGGKGAGLGAAIGAAVGSALGPLGTAIGSLFGGLIGGLFDDEGTVRIQVVGTEALDSLNGYGNRRLDIETELGGFVISNATNLSEEAVQQVSEAISDFDNAIAQFLTPDQINSVTERLERFGREYENEQASIQEIIGDRFSLVLESFNANIRNFVGEFSSLEKQIAAFGVATTAQKVFEELPQLFGDAAFTDFLAVIQAFSAEAGGLEKAFDRVLGLLDQVGSAIDALGDFAVSDLSGDYAAIVEAQNRSAGESLSLLNQELTNAILNFDGSADSLTEIGNIMVAVREGEIRYLTQLDALQKGLNANLDALKADIIGLTAPDLDATQILGQARGLISEVRFSTSAEDVADIGQQFNALIRSLGEEDQVFNQGMILALINDFQRAANSVIDQFRTDAVDNADSMRDLVDVFINDIGDPLSIIAATNERAAQALELLAGTQIQPEALNVTPMDSEGYDFSEQEIILSNGLADMNETVGEIGPAVANAILQGLGNVQIIINQDPSLVNQ